MALRIPAVLLLLAAVSACSPPTSEVASTRSGPPGAARPADAQTREAVDAADAFLATLTEAQRRAVLFAFNDQAQRTRWSNFPVGMVPRGGVRWGELSPGQRAAAMTLLSAILSEQGIAMVQEQMWADDTLRRPDSGRPPGAGAPQGANPSRPQGGPVGNPNFGSDHYYVSILGTPSATTPWMLQFGGHHLGINATVAGPNITLSPSLTGGQPLKFEKDGRTISIVENEVTQSRALLRSLTPEQQRKAVLSTSRIDLVLGPGHDGKVLQPEGLPAGEMTAAQKEQLLALVRARLDIVNDDDLAALMAVVRRALDQTYFGWWGPTDPAGAAYFRVTGPQLLLEFSPQTLGGDPTQHAHNMYRDPTNEYGAAWTSPR